MRLTRTTKIAVPVAALALALTACAGGSTADPATPAATSSAPASPSVASPSAPAESPAASETPAESPTAEEPAVVVPESLEFTGTTVDGAEFDAAELAGKPVVLWFWAPWCSVCRVEAPDVSAVAAEYGDEVSFVGIAGRGPVEDMQAFVSDTGIEGFTQVADVDGSLWSRFGVVTQPSYVFITSSGEAEFFAGGLDAAGLTEVAEQLLAG